jgi:hypothetical protein
MLTMSQANETDMIVDAAEEANDGAGPQPSLVLHNIPQGTQHVEGLPTPETTPLAPTDAPTIAEPLLPAVDIANPPSPPAEAPVAVAVDPAPAPVPPLAMALGALTLPPPPTELDFAQFLGTPTPGAELLPDLGMHLREVAAGAPLPELPSFLGAPMPTLTPGVQPISPYFADTTQAGYFDTMPAHPPPPVHAGTPIATPRPRAMLERRAPPESHEVGEAQVSVSTTAESAETFVDVAARTMDLPTDHAMLTTQPSIEDVEPVLDTPSGGNDVQDGPTAQDEIDMVYEPMAMDIADDASIASSREEDHVFDFPPEQSMLHATQESQEKVVSDNLKHESVLQEQHIFVTEASIVERGTPLDESPMLAHTPVASVDDFDDIPGLSQSIAAPAILPTSQKSDITPPATQLLDEDVATPSQELEEDELDSNTSSISISGLSKDSGTEGDRALFEDTTLSQRPAGLEEETIPLSSSVQPAVSEEDAENQEDKDADGSVDEEYIAVADSTLTPENGLKKDADEEEISIASSSPLSEHSESPLSVPSDVIRR